MKLIIFGPPGSGKSTQANVISKEFKLKHISSEILKNEVKKGTKLGKEFEKYIEKGDLVPENLILPLIKKFIVKDNFISDGFPRTLTEAKFLDKYAKPDIVLVLDVPYHVLKSRLLKRAKLEHRIDDNEDTIKERFKVYRKQTRPLLKYYKDRITLIDGDDSVENIEKEIVKILKK